MATREAKATRAFQAMTMVTATAESSSGDPWRRRGSPLLLPRLLPLLVLPCVCLLAGRAEALWLSLPETGTKCVSEEIQSNVVVLADYNVVYTEDDHGLDLPTISAKVTSPHGNNLHRQKNVTSGQFAFTTTEPGNYLACFWIDGHHQHVEVSVNVEWRTGIGAKDWDSVARKEKIEGVELELRKLEGAVEAIHENLLYLRDREAEMRTVSETTNSRVARFSLMSLGICIMVSALQVWHLRGYFRKKKLI